MALQLTKQFPHTITVDGQTVRLHFKKMTVEEHTIARAQFEAYNDERGKPAEAITSAKALSADQRAWLEGNVAWLREVFAQFVTVEPGDLEVDGEGVTGGRELFDALGSYEVILQDILFTLFVDQTLTPEQKKTFQSQLASATGSSAPPPAGDGPTPAPAAASAATAGTAASAPVTDPDAALSGTTSASSSVPVLSGS